MSGKVNQKRYSLMLINIDPKVHQAYKKLACQQQTRHRNTTQSTNPTTKYTNGNYPNSNTSRNRNTKGSLTKSNSGMKSAYDNFLLLRNQSSYPFGLTEQRFKWQKLDDKSNPINPDDVKNHLRRIPIKNSFDGGFENFFNMNHRQKIKRNNSVSILYDKRNYGLNSQRVIYPEKNNDKRDISQPRGKKCCFIDAYGKEKEKKLRHSTGGSMKSLLDETPMSFPVRGKRKVHNTSFDNKGTLNLFSEDYGKPQTQVHTYKRMHFNDVIFKSKFVIN